MPGASRPFLKVLCNLRWLALAGQAVTILLVTRWLHIPLHTGPLWGGVAALVLFNSFAVWRVRHSPSSGPAEVFAHLMADIALLAWMVSWSGGIENPFSSLFLLPIALSILALPARWMWATAAVSVLAYALSAWVAVPLPHGHSLVADAFGLHKAGMLANFVVSAMVMLLFFSRMTAAWRQSEREVARLQERFARNEGIVALATHAASVAHELNTPLATLTLMVDDLHDEAEGPRRAEYATMRALLEVCRDRVRDLARPASAGDGGRAQSVDVEQVIERWQLLRPTIELRRTGTAAGLHHVDPAIGHLMQALLNNAAEASAQANARQVDLHVEACGAGMRAVVRDYGAGFASTPPPLPGTLFRSDKPGGLGIGLALSHATVERLGGTLSMEAAASGPGVVVSFFLPVTSLA